MYKLYNLGAVYITPISPHILYSVAVFTHLFTTFLVAHLLFQSRGAISQLVHQYVQPATACPGLCNKGLIG